MENKLVTALEDLPLTGCRFVSLSGYESKTGEVANYTINAGIDYGNAVKQDEAFLANYEPLPEDITNFESKLPEKHTSVEGFSAEALLVEARDALLKSIRKETESSVVASKAQTDAYESVGPAIRRHKESGALSIYGLKRSKTIVTESPTPRKTVNSRPLTLAKNFISNKYLKTANFRSLLLDKVKVAKVNGETLILE